jgi:hypothetical protein
MNNFKVYAIGSGYQSAYWYQGELSKKGPSGTGPDRCPKCARSVSKEVE